MKKTQLLSLSLAYSLVMLHYNTLIIAYMFVFFFTDLKAFDHFSFVLITYVPKVEIQALVSRIGYVNCSKW